MQAIINTEDTEATDTETIAEPKRYQCRHIFADGRRCGSASLRGEPFCYYHHTTRKPVARPHQRRSRRSTFALPLPEDRSAIQLSIGQVLQRIAANQIDPRRAGLLLYGLQIASLNLPREAAPTRADRSYSSRHAEPADTVEEVITDPELGPLAPATEMAKAHKVVIQTLLENLKDLDTSRPEPTNFLKNQPTQESPDQPTEQPTEINAEEPEEPEDPQILSTLQACEEPAQPATQRVPHVPLLGHGFSPSRTISSVVEWRDPLYLFCLSASSVQTGVQCPDRYSTV